MRTFTDANYIGLGFGKKQQQHKIASSYVSNYFSNTDTDSLLVNNEHIPSTIRIGVRFIGICNYSFT